MMDEIAGINCSAQQTMVERMYGSWKDTEREKMRALLLILKEQEGRQL